VSGLTHKRLEVCLSHYLVLLLFKNIAGLDYWNEILGLANFSLQAFPDLVSGESR
jgi:hypothetical protein